MKRNYLAILLGLTLAVSPMSAYAGENTTEAATEAASEESATETDETEKNEVTGEQIVGQVSKISKDSITITKGTLQADESEDADVEDADTENADATDAGVENADTEHVDAAVTGEDEMTLILSDESLSYDLPEDVSFRELTEKDPIAVVKKTDVADEEEAALPEEDSKDSVEEPATDAADNAADDTANDAADVSEVIGGADDTDASQSEEDTFAITSDGIMEGDIVSIQLNQDGSVASVTILAYGSGSFEDTEVAADLPLEDTETELMTE